MSLVRDSSYLGRVVTARSGCHTTRHKPHMPRQVLYPRFFDGVEQLRSATVPRRPTEVRRRPAPGGQAGRLGRPPSGVEVAEASRRTSTVSSRGGSDFGLRSPTARRRRARFERALRLTRVALALPELGASICTSRTRSPARTSRAVRHRRAGATVRGLLGSSSLNILRAAGHPRRAGRRPAPRCLRDVEPGRKLVRTRRAPLLSLRSVHPGEQKEPAADDHNGHAEPDLVRDRPRR